MQRPVSPLHRSSQTIVMCRRRDRGISPSAKSNRSPEFTMDPRLKGILALPVMQSHGSGRAVRTEWNWHE